MNEVNDESELKPLLCGCGRKVRYSHFKGGEEVMSCNKYTVCPTYDELQKIYLTLNREKVKT